MIVNKSALRAYAVFIVIISSILFLSGCASSDKTESVKVITNEEGSTSLTENLPSDLESSNLLEHGENGEDVKCPVDLPEQAVSISSMGWTIPATGPEVISPEFTEICKFTYLEQGYVVTVAEFNSASSLREALKVLEDPNQGFVYMGLPTSFIANKIPKEGVVVEGSMSTDDCGMAGDEIMDENCAIGYALMRWEGSKMVVISDMFIANHTPITAIPQELLKYTFPKN